MSDIEGLNKPKFYHLNFKILCRKSRQYSGQTAQIFAGRQPSPTSQKDTAPPPKKKSHIERRGIRPDKCQSHLLKSWKSPGLTQCLLLEAGHTLASTVFLIWLSCNAINEQDLEWVLRHLTTINPVRRLCVSVLCVMRSVLTFIIQLRYCAASACAVECRPRGP